MAARREYRAGGHDRRSDAELRGRGAEEEGGGRGGGKAGSSHTTCDYVLQRGHDRMFWSTTGKTYYADKIALTTDLAIKLS